MAYPDTLDDLRTDVANETLELDAHPEVTNATSAAVNAVQLELGLNPAGGHGSVAARLAATEALLGAPATTISGDGIPDPGIGNDGDYYIQVDADPPLIFGPKTGGDWGDSVELGGGTMLSGDGPPPSDLGSTGDFYVDLATDPSDLYGPKADLNWGLPVNLGASTGAGGAAGGVLTGTYPNPAFAVDMATQAELDAIEAEIGDIAGIPVLGGVTPPGNFDGLDDSWWFDTVTGKLYGPKTSGVWDLDNPVLLGGIAVTTGGLTPTNDIGGDGDLFIKTSTSDMYVKDSGDWGSAIPLIGPQGDPGANVVPQGVWDSGTTYHADDLVQYQGSSYYAVATTTNNVPITDDGTHWKVFVAKGQTGATGAGFLEGLVLPASNNTPIPTVTPNVGSTNTCRFVAMNPIPFDGVLDSLAVYIGTPSGNFKLVVYDTGQTTPDSYTQLFASASTPATASNDWQVVNFVGLDVLSGDRLLFGLVPNNATLTLGRFTNGLTAAAATLPVEFAPTSTRVKMGATRAGFTFDAPAPSVTEANMVATNVQVAIIGQVTGV